LREFLEQLGLLLGCHADAGIGNGNLDPVATIHHLFDAQLNPPSLVNLQALLKRLRRICRSRMGSMISGPKCGWS
jgi:hypothetical protein